MPTLFPLPNNVGGTTEAIQVSLGPDNGLAAGISAATVPSLVGRTRLQATTAIAAAGLTVGPVGQTTDCNNLNKVSDDQNPVAGTLVAPGSAVSFDIGQPRAKGVCP